MRTIINIGLFLVVVLLSFLLVSSIRGPILFKGELDARKSAVVSKLEEHRTCQTAFKNIVGEFAKDYDTLKHVLLTDSFEIVKVVGDPDAVGGGEITKSYSYISAKDSIAKVLNVNPSELGAFIDQLGDIPFSEGSKFEMTADTMTYQKILVPVLKVETQYKEFMKGFEDEKYKRYDSSFDPEAYIGYGSLSKPSTSGTWD